MRLSGPNYVKYRNGMLIIALAVGVGVVAVAVYFLRTDDSSSAVAPSSWIVDAAVAMNRASIHGEEVRNDARLPAGNSAAARQFAQQGERLRVQRKFAEAEAAYREAVEADPMDADSWADLADSAAAAAGKDLTKSRDAIMRALAIDPHHHKALWLRASLELQELHYAERCRHVAGIAVTGAGGLRRRTGHRREY